MKKIFYFLLLISLFPLKVNATYTYIDNYYINIDIEEDGDALIKEFFTYKGKFNGATKKLTYDTIKNDSLESYIETELYSPTGIVLNVIKNIKVDENINFNYIYNNGTIFERNDNASIGSTGYYSVTTGYKEYIYKIFNPGTYKGFYIEYILEDVVINHQDVSELWLNFLRENEDDVKHLEIVVNLPKNIEILKSWAHGPLNGNIEILNNQKVLFSVDNLNKNANLDIRLAFDNYVNSSKKTDNVVLDDIIEYETVLANIANEEREKARKELEKYEKNQKIRSKFFNFFSFFWIIGLMFIIKFIYENYDKEYISEFKGKYFRDIPSDQNPALIGYLVNKKIRTEDLSATILNLINNKIIEFSKLEKNNYKFILTDESSVSKLEKLVIDLLFDGAHEITLNEFKKRAKNGYNEFLTKYNEWYNEAIQQAKNENYFENKIKVKLFSIMYSVIGFSLLFLSNKYVNNILFIVLIVLSFISIIYFISYTKRTKVGNEEYLKWIGLKNFMNDFGKMNIKELPEVRLWEKYLVYAVTLGCASKLSKTMKIKINDFNDDDLKMDFIDFNTQLLLITNMNTSVTSSVNSALSQAKSIAASKNSSGSGYGGGFSSGGGFSGGGGGSTGHF